MSVTINQLVLYGCASQTEADGVTVGGAPDITKRLGFLDFPSAATVDVVSSSASDVATKGQIVGRDSTGTIQSPVSVTLTGQTKVNIATTLAHLLYCVISGAAAGGPLADPGGTAAVGDVAFMSHTLTIGAHTAQAGSANTTGTTPPIFKLQAGDGATVQALIYGGIEAIVRTTGGTGANQIRRVVASSSYGTDVVAVNRDWTVVPDGTTTYEVAAGMLCEILPNPVTAVIRLFSGAAAAAIGGASEIYYDKGFILNTNASVAATVASVKLVSQSPGEPSGGTLNVALTNGGSGTTKGLNDSTTINPRLNAVPPANTTGYVGNGSSISVPNTNQNLPSGNAAANSQGVWFQQTLAAGTAPYEGAIDLQALFQTI